LKVLTRICCRQEALSWIRRPQALIGLVGRLDGPQPGVGEAGPVEVDDHPPAPSVLVGLKPQHLAIFGQLGDDGRLLTRNRRVQRPMTGGHHGWRFIPGSITGMG
jgi:hypothetical protein